MTRSVFTLAFLAALALSGAALAEAHQPQCSENMLTSVRQQMPQRLSHLDPGDLSCNGLAQVFFIFTDPNIRSPIIRNQRIEAVFRREGLTR